MTLGDYFINVAEAAIALSHDYKKDGDSFSTLAVLLDLEDSLDKGRSLIQASGREQLASINEKLEVLREEIRNILDGLPSSDARMFLEARGERLKEQFQIKG